MQKYLHEMLLEIDSDLDLLNSTYKNNPMIKLLFDLCYNKSNKFNLPSGIINYKSNGYKVDLAPINLFSELTSLKMFCRKDIKESKLLSIFIQLLEQLSENDVKILLAIKNQDLSKLYPRLSVSNLKPYGYSYN